MSESLVWIVPEEKGGIRSYAEGLWPSVAEAAERNGLAPLEPVFGPLSDSSLVSLNLAKLKALNPSLIHVQHEYGLFGRKLPGLYAFPEWVSSVRSVLPDARIVATAHTVLGPEYRYPVSGRKIQAPLRWISNHSVLPFLRWYWGRSSWRGLDGVIVHSALQLAPVQEAGCPHVQAIPHFVPRAGAIVGKKESRAILVFGFISPEKGQDVAIRALSHLPSDVKLVLAGGIRRPEDRPYLARCRALIGELKLTDRVEITGFVPPDQIDSLFGMAGLVLAPFRETSGSGSLAQALALGAPVLASDLPLNREINDREESAIALFRTEDPEDCARQAWQLLNDPTKCESLGQVALRYADKWGASRVAEMHVSFYSGLLARRTGVPVEGQKISACVP